MSTPEDPTLRHRVRELLRVSRFQNWSVDKLEDELTKLFRGGVDVQDPAQPVQIPEPPQPGAAAA
jgi:hypothetical protein